MRDLDPREYALAVLWWWHDHANCPHGRCSRAYLEEGERRPCPPPPPMPEWTSCPGYSLREPRLVECGGCHECGPGHLCHLTGEEQPCTWQEAECPPGAVTLNADRNLFTALEEHLGEGLAVERSPEQAQKVIEELLAWLSVARPFVAAAEAEDTTELVDAFEQFMELAVNELGGAF